MNWSWTQLSILMVWNYSYEMNLIIATLSDEMMTVKKDLKLLSSAIINWDELIFWDLWKYFTISARLVSLIGLTTFQGWPTQECLDFRFQSLNWEFDRLDLCLKGYHLEWQEFSNDDDSNILSQNCACNSEFSSTNNQFQIRSRRPKNKLAIKLEISQNWNKLCGCSFWLFPFRIRINWSGKKLE